MTKKVNTPNYYKGKHYKYEAHEIIEDFAGDNYNIGVAIAYLLRSGKKSDNPIEQDIKKAIDHLNFELKRQQHLKENTNTQIQDSYINENTNRTDQCCKGKCK